MRVQIRTLPTRCAGWEIPLPQPRTGAPSTLPRKIKNPITCPYCGKTYSSHGRLLMRIELAPQKGSRYAGICPRLNTEDAPEEKRVRVLLRMKENTPELRLQPEKPPYRLHPINRMEPNGPLQQQEQQKQVTKELNHANAGTCQWGQQPPPTPQTLKKETPQQPQQKDTETQRNRKIKTNRPAGQHARTIRDKERIGKTNTWEGESSPRPRDEQQEENRNANQNRRNRPLKDMPARNKPAKNRPTHENQYKNRNQLERRRQKSALHHQQEQNNPTKDCASRKDSRGEDNRRRRKKHAYQERTQ